MLYTVFVWIVLTIACYSMGYLILNCLFSSFVTRTGDRLILSIWVGIVGLSLLLLALSFIVPLSTTTGIIIYTVVTIITLYLHNKNQELKQLKQHLTSNYLIIYLVTALATGAIVNRKSLTWFDTGLYHWHSIKWLSEFGTVTGVGLINSKHGFNASWFAFSAPLHISGLGSHVAPVSNGFLFLIATVHFFITVRYIIKQNSGLSDWFISLFYGVILPVYGLTSYTKSPILISYSPDIPVNFFIGVIAWTILLTSNSQEKIMNSDKITSDKTKNHLLAPRFLPLFIALGAVTFKLTAIPLAFVTFLFAFIQCSQKFKSLIISSLLSIVLLTPMFAYSIKTTGCLLYPSSAICFNVPWALNTKTVKKETGLITGMRKVDPNKNYALVVLQKRWQWFQSSYKLQIMIFLLFISLVESIIFFKQKQYQKFAGSSWIVPLGFVGMLFIILQIPLIRFGLGYFLLISCLLGGILLTKNNFLPFLNNNKEDNLARYSRVSFLLIAVLSLFTVVNLPVNNLFIPASLPIMRTTKAQVNDIEYFHPDSQTFRCWDAPLPCSPSPIDEDIVLKNPNQGMGKGFINREQ